MFTTIANFFKSSKGFQIALVFIIILVGGVSFGLGRLSALNSARAPIRIEYPQATAMDSKSSPQANLGQEASGQARSTNSGQGSAGAVNTAAVANAVPTPVKKTSGMYVASRSGTAYHLPWCPGAQKIKEENKIWFDSKAEAEKAGYHAAGNCKGI